MTERRMDDLSRPFHEAADATDDEHDHAELHAAGAIMFSDPVYAETDRDVRLWLEGLRRRHRL